MDKNKIAEMLNKKYTVELKGSALGYILTVMAAEQQRLEEKRKNDITDIGAVMAAVANDMVGNDLLRAAYDAAGEEFLGFAMGLDPKAMKKVMETDDAEVIKKTFEKERKIRKSEDKRTLN